MFVSYPVNSALVRRCPVISVSVGTFCATLLHYGSFPWMVRITNDNSARRSVLSMFKKFPPDKRDRDALLMYGHCVAYMLHKPIERAPSVRGDEFVTG